MRKDAHLEVNKLIDYLGGIDNIVDKKVNLSRFIVTLRDVNLADKEAIQSLGAKGIVEIDNQLPENPDAKEGEITKMTEADLQSHFCLTRSTTLLLSTR